MDVEREQLDLIRNWWEAWRISDYSWEGLAEKNWDGISVDPEGKLVNRNGAPEGSRNATLQDYWREEEARLIPGDGKYWTRVHCPMEFEDGTPGKAEWSEEDRLSLDELVKEKLLKSLEVERTDDQILGPDRRAQMDGVILFALPPLPPKQMVTATFARSAFRDDVSLNCILGRGSHLAFCLFLGRSSFSGLVWRGVASIRSSIFVGDASFFRCYFGDNLSGDKLQFLGDANFREAVFLGNAWLPYCRFFRRSNFFGAKFEGDLEFGYSTFGSVEFNQAKFVKRARFASSTFEDYAGFQCRFEAEADFQEAVFKGDAFLDGVDFGGPAHFARARFDGSATFFGAKFASRAWFEETIFSTSVKFDQATFASLADFSGGQFHERVSFRKVAFSGRFISASREYLGNANFDSVAFKTALDFYGARFHNFASFQNVEWPDTALGWHAAFDQVLFSGITTFSGSGFGRLAAFAGAVFERSVAIDDEVESEADRIFRHERVAAGLAARRDLDEWLETRETETDVSSRVRGSARDVRQMERTFDNTRLGELERGCRVLKKAFASVSDGQREQTLYRFELRARRAQPRISRAEKLLSSLYGLSADYGGSVVRPLLGMSFVLLVFASVFLGCGAILDQVPSQALLPYVSENSWESVTFSWNNMFRPLSVLSIVDDPSAGNSWETRLIFDHSDLARFVLLVLGTIQSLSSVTLAFLFLLAVRRRFQID